MSKQKSKVSKNNIENKIPPTKEEKNAKVINIDNIEEVMLKGQIHEESHIINNNKLKIIEENKTDNKKEIESENNKKIKKEIIIKPRETYLKDKIQKNFSQTLISKVNKSLDSQIKNIKIDLKDDKVKITKNSKNLKKFFPSESKDKIILTSDENYKLKNKMRQIKELKNQEKNIQNKLSILLSNEKFLNEKETFNPPKKTKFIPGVAQGSIPPEERLKIIEKEKIKKKKEELVYKLNKTKIKINDIINVNNDETKKLKIKNFLNNFERDKEIIEIRSKKYYEESKQIQNRMKKDLQSLIQKKKKEMEEQEEKVKKQKKDYIEKLRTKEKEVENKRLKECKKRASLFQSFSFNKPSSKAEECLFNIRTEKYLIKEANYYRKEKSKRKFLIKSMTKEELDDFSRNYDDYKNEYYKKAEEKQKELFLEWKKRKEKLPNFMSSFFEIADLESKKNQEIEKENKEKIEYLLQNKKDYSEKIKEEKKPKIDTKLKRKRLNEIFKRQNPKLAIIKDALLKRKQRKQRKIFSQSKSETRIKSILKKGKNKNKSKPKSSKSQNNNKHRYNFLTELNKSEIIKKNLIHKPKKIIFVHPSSSTGNIQKIKTDNKINYYKRMNNHESNRINNVNKSNKSFSFDISKKNNGKKINEIIRKKDKKLNEIDFGIIKRKADMLDKEAEKNEKMLMISGGIASNPKLGRKVSNLILDSIQAKLSILNQINQKI